MKTLAEVKLSDQNFVRDLSIPHLIEHLAKEDPERLISITTIFKHASTVSVTLFEPFIVRLINVIDLFKDPTTLATHLETINNLCQVEQFIRIMLETDLKEKLYELHHDCVVKQHSS